MAFDGEAGRTLNMNVKNYLLFLIPLTLGLSSCMELFECQYEIVSSSISPNGESTANLVDVGCGATTGFTNWITINEIDKEPNFERERIAVFKGLGDKISWVSEKKFDVTGDIVLWENESQYVILVNGKAQEPKSNMIRDE